MSSPARCQWQTKQHGTGQADRRRQESLNLCLARAQWPGRRGKRHSSFARREEFPAKGPHQNGVLVPLPPWAKEPAAGAAELPRYVLSKDGKNQRSPGAGSEECQHSSRLPPDPVTGDASRESFLESGAGGTADCFPFRTAAAGWAIQRRPSQLDDENAPGACSRRGWYVIGGRRNAAPTQGPGPGCRGGLWPPVVYRQTKQHGISQAAPVGAADPNLHRARAQWPGRRSRGHSSFARREEFPAKGPHQKRRFGSFAAVGKGTRRRSGGTSPLCSFQGWKEPKIPGGWLRGVPALQSPASGPRYGGRFPGVVPRIRRGWCS